MFSGGMRSQKTHTFLSSYPFCNPSSSSDSSSDSDSDSDSLEGLSDDEDKKAGGPPSMPAPAQTLATRPAAPKRDLEADSMIQLAPGPPPAPVRPAPAPTNTAAAPVPRKDIAVKLPPSQPVQPKDFKVDNLSAWGSLAGGGSNNASRSLSPVNAANLGDRPAPSPPAGDSTLAEFKRKALEQQQRVCCALFSRPCYLCLGALVAVVAVVGLLLVLFLFVLMHWWLLRSMPYCHALFWLLLVATAPFAWSDSDRISPS